MYGRLIPIAAVGVLVTFGAAIAATATGTFTVQMTIAASCTVNTSFGALNFGTHSAITAAIDAQQNVGVTCSHTVPWNLQMSAGANYASGSRQMASGANRIRYELYRDSSRTLLWGEINGTNTLAGSGTQTVPVYGRVEGAQGSPPVGTYTDTITVTVEY